MKAIREGILQRILARLNLRFPGLFVLFCGLTILDIIVPDFVPFLDEIGFALLTALFGLWKNRRK